MASLNAALGNAVRKRRVALALSQEELADRARLHRTYISLLERGLRTASVETIYKLACALEVRASDLMEDIDRERGPDTV